MSNPTSNFGWQMPTNTDLVTNLPADFEVFGQAVDSDFADLKGGTAGQILSKNSNTDLDFVWITNEIGDITAITATSPLTGGGTSGAVTVGIQSATTGQSGAVQLTDSTSSTSTTTAATPNAVKTAYDLAAAALPKVYTFNPQTGTTYQPVIGDVNKLITLSNASTITVTLNPSVFSAGQTFDIQQTGAGQVVFAQGTGVTITSTGATVSAPKIAKQYGAAQVICMVGGTTPTFTVIGALS